MDRDEFNLIPIIITAGAITFLGATVLSLLLRQGKPHYGSRGSGESEASSSRVREIMRELDPVDSLYFDISVARHSLEEGDIERAKRWLDGTHALGELRRSISMDFIKSDEGLAIEGNILEALRLINEGKINEAYRKLIDIQDKVGEITYTAIARKFKEEGVDPPEIDAKFEPLREKKRSEWKAKGVPPGLIEKALIWAEEWARGIARRFVKPPELAAKVAEALYPEALELSEKYIKAFYPGL